MNQSTTYSSRRGEIETYFDRTAVEAWRRLTSDAPVNSIRATVRAGRDRMRATLLGWLPEDLSGARVLDAGCGTGSMAVELARRGADVLAIDLSPQLISLACERSAGALGSGTIQFEVGDMLDATRGLFDHVVAMDSIIHYAPDDAARVLTSLAGQTRRSLVCTFAPRTPLLTLMHLTGRLFPSQATRAPAIVPVTMNGLTRRFSGSVDGDWSVGRTERVSSAFYKSQALEFVRR